jgi:hypothetical protein
MSLRDRKRLVLVVVLDLDCLRIGGEDDLEDEEE